MSILRRFGRESAYLLLAAVLSVPTFALALLALVSAALSAVIFGLLLLGGLLFLARLTVRYFRAPARRLLGWDWPNPPALPATTRWGRFVAVFGDSAAWRALAYCFLHFPLMYAGAYGLVVGLFSGLVLPFLHDYSWRDRLIGVLLLLVLPWFVRGVVLVDSLLVRALLRPTRAARRIAQLEAGRAALQADATATLRRVERDLHDGTQARMVALGVAFSRIASLSQDDPVRRVALDARRTVTEGLTELRDIVRGLHPPALDDGLDVALSTLAGRSAVPATVEVALPARPPDATATAVYFTVAELLTNIARHSGATRAGIQLAGDGAFLTLTVTDNGAGGATSSSSGTGLAGLGRRASSLDGSLEIDSPPGGPTVITVTLPWGY